MNEIQINTTQNVIINFETANVGSRILAFVIDMIIILSYLGAIFFLVDKFGLFDSFDDNWSIMAIVSLAMLPAMFYTLASEFFMEGQTLGKIIVKIKVVKLDGYQLSGFDHLTRWLFRLVDIFLIGGTGAMAVLSISFTKNQQRLGDMAAGTTVISVKNLWNINSTILENLSQNYQPRFPSVINLSDNDMRIISDTFRTASKNDDDKLIAKLRKKVEEITKTKKERLSDKRYLQIIMKDYTHFTQNM